MITSTKPPAAPAMPISTGPGFLLLVSLGPREKFPKRNTKSKINNYKTKLIKLEREKSITIKAQSFQMTNTTVKRHA